MISKDYKKDNFNYGVVDLNIKNSKVCPTIDPLGGCSVVDCLKCDNCNHSIVLATRNISDSFSGNCKDIERYIVEFFDEVDTGNIIGYLDDDNSDYRITREKDGVILRYSKTDLINLDNEINKISGDDLGDQDIYGEYIFGFEEDVKEEPTSFVKKIIRKIGCKLS